MARLKRPARPRAGRIEAGVEETTAGGDFRTWMLGGNALTLAWRLNYVANFYAVPFYLALEQHAGISRPEYVILFCVLHRPGTTAQEIVGATGRPKNSISVAVKRLVAKNLVVRQTSAADSRRFELRATVDGRRIYRAVLPLLRQREQAMLAALSADERAQLDTLLLKIALDVPRWASVDLSALAPGAGGRPARAAARAAKR